MDSTRILQSLYWIRNDLRDGHEAAVTAELYDLIDELERETAKRPGRSFAKQVTDNG